MFDVNVLVNWFHTSIYLTLFNLFDIHNPLLTKKNAIDTSCKLLRVQDKQPGKITEKLLRGTKKKHINKHNETASYHAPFEGSYEKKGKMYIYCTAQKASITNCLSPQCGVGKS